MKVVLLSGAGFSKWSCQLPLVSRLFDFRILPDNVNEQEKLENVKRLYRSWKKNNPHANNEAFVKFVEPSLRDKQLVGWYITRRLTEKFIIVRGRRYTWYINSRRANYHRGISKAKHFFKLLRRFGDLKIVTTNYDFICEYALGSRDFNYGIIGEQIGFTPYPYVIPVHAKGAVQINKLHGSISWDQTRKYPDLRCGLTGKCLIVPPIEEKIAPVQLREQWKYARSALRSADVLIVFGFSFNEYDKALRDFIQSNVGASTDVIIIDTSNICFRIRKLFKKNRILYIDPTQPKWRSKLKAILSEI